MLNFHRPRNIHASTSHPHDRGARDERYTSIFFLLRILNLSKCTEIAKRWGREEDHLDRNGTERNSNDRKQNLLSCRLHDLGLTLGGLKCKRKNIRFL